MFLVSWFLAKCVDAGWLLEVSFQLFFPIAVIVDVDIAFLGRNRSFGRHVASTLASEQQEGYKGVQDHTFINLGMLLGPRFETCSG